MGSAFKTQRILAEMRSGKRVKIPMWVVDSGKPGPQLLLMAAQHGNEVMGSEAIRRFVAIAAKRMKAGKVFAIPFANPPALWERRAHIGMKPEQPYKEGRPRNMNLLWPGNPRGNDSARLAYAIHRAIDSKATHVLDLHCWERFHAAAVLMLDYPGMRDMARKIGHRFVVVCPGDSGYARTIGGYFCSTGRLGLLSYEFAGQYAVYEDEVRDGLRVIMNYARLIGILPGRLQKGYDSVLFSDKVGTAETPAPCNGLFVAGSSCRLCAPVRKGQLLGHILSDRDLNCREVVAPASGYLAYFGPGRPNSDVSLPAQHPYVAKGDVLAKIQFAKRR